MTFNRWFWWKRGAKPRRAIVGGNRKRAGRRRVRVKIEGAIYRLVDVAKEGEKMAREVQARKKKHIHLGEGWVFPELQHEIP